jgi:hypothetical protein
LVKGTDLVSHTTVGQAQEGIRYTAKHNFKWIMTKTNRMRQTQNKEAVKTKFSGIT